jgi:hypothetical protein
MSEIKRTQHIAFRLTDEEYTQIENAVLALGEEANNSSTRLSSLK